ncbi:zona pellucida domain protein papillote [Oratosquilla oratoria]|uniref:zona pellucida domain protein papillote n=1 Tax=Oratosquilla oratoria TaxID=337810 RepID=UPI003F775BEC
MTLRGMLQGLVWACVLASAAAQYIGEDDKTPIQETAVIDGKNTVLDNIGPTIYTNRTTTHLNCAAGSMLVDIEFKEDFYGLIYPNGSRNSACRSFGNGKRKYHLDLPLKGCGTQRVERRVFLNNIIVRFHRGLELEGDEVKTIICRYPSPAVVTPAGIPFPIISPATPVGAPKGVNEVELLLIVCTILFLALLLVGMACSYTCLKKRNIRLIRRRAPLSLGPASDITKLTGSSLMFEGLKIPRAHATSTSDSDTALVSQSDTLPSDYPSESPSSGSEVEEVDVHSVERRTSSASSRVSAMRQEQVEVYENHAFEDERLSSVYSDAMVQSEAEIVAAPQVSRLPQPTFMVRVKKAPTPTPPRTPEPDYPVQLAHAQSLTTILERDESFRGESIPGSEHAILLSEAEDLNPPPALIPGPVYAKVQRRIQEELPPPPPPPSDYGSVARSVSEHELEISTHVVPAPPPPPPLPPPQPRRDIRNVETVETVVQETTDIQEHLEANRRAYLVRRAPSEPESEYPSEARSVTDVVEELSVVPRLPQVTTHTVDDVYHSTVTQTRTEEDIERHRRYIKQYHVKPKALPPPKWNVAIRHYPAPRYADEVESSGPEWEAYSEPGSEIFRQHLYPHDQDLPRHQVETLEHPPPPNWNVLLRVLDPPPTQRAVTEVLTIEDREKWRQILTTESTLLTMLTQATVKEDYERIRHDQRYEKLFEPRKWDVIIRILAPPDVPDHRGGDSSSEAPSASDTESLCSRDGRRYRRRQEHPPPVRKTSLPPLYEYDSAGNPIVTRRPGPPSARSRRSSKSSVHSGVDVRSMTETEVNFARADTWSEASGPSTVSGARSIADRSHSEITYTVPVLPDDDYLDTDNDDRLSARTGRSLARSASEFTEDWRQEQQDRYSAISASSGDSRRTRTQRERSSSEFQEAAPHLSDFMTSPDHSPQQSPVAAHRFVHYTRGYELHPGIEADFDPERSLDEDLTLDLVHRQRQQLQRELQEHHQQQFQEQLEDNVFHTSSGVAQRSSRVQTYTESHVAGWSKKQ